MTAAQAIADPFVLRTEVYDGPLEVLLYLVQRDGIDIVNLSLAHVTREYLAWIDRLRELDLDVAGEFLVMAATLCELKSRELLPKSLRRALQSEEDEDPRQALVLRLLEYRRYREVADGLRNRMWLGRDVFAREPVPLGLSERPLDPGVDVFGLLEAYHAALLRRESRPFHRVDRAEVCWKDCIVRVLHALDDGRKHTLDELLADLPGRPYRVMAFLALLELARTEMIRIGQKSHLSPVFLKSLVKAASADLSSVAEVS